MTVVSSTGKVVQEIVFTDDASDDLQELERFYRLEDHREAV